MAKGYIKVSKEVVKAIAGDHDLLAVYMYCLVEAAHEDEELDGMVIPEGSFVTSQETMCKDLGMTRQTLRTCLRKLAANQQTNQQFCLKCCNKYTIITMYGSTTCVKGGLEAKKSELTNKLTNCPPTSCIPESVATTDTNVSSVSTNSYIHSVTPLPLKGVSPQGFSVENGESENEPWMEVLQEWVAYHDKVAKKYKSASYPAILKQLKRLSGESVPVARQVIQQSMENGWQGLFELKQGARVSVAAQKGDNRMDAALAGALELLRNRTQNHEC